MLSDMFQAPWFLVSACSVSEQYSEEATSPPAPVYIMENNKAAGRSGETGLVFLLCEEKRRAALP